MSPGRKNSSHAARGNNIINDNSAKKIIKSVYYKPSHKFSRNTTKMYTNYANIGSIMCKENDDWIQKVRMTYSNKLLVIDDENKNMITTPNQQITKGAYGDIWIYKDESGKKKCALKIMKKVEIPQMNAGGVSGFSNVHGLNQDENFILSQSTVLSTLCDLIVYTKFFLGTKKNIYQIMEMGTGTAYDSSRVRKIPTRTFVQFCIDVCRCIIKAKLAYCDTKLQNIIYTDCKEPNDSPFRLIDVDSIVPCIMPRREIFLNTETLKMKYPPSTYPIITYSKVECPAIIVLQTWYSFMVSMILYKLSYNKKNDIFKYLQYNLSWENKSYFENKNYDEITQKDILSDDHPMMQGIHLYGDLIGQPITRSIMNMKGRLADGQQYRIKSCQSIRDSSDAQRKNDQTSTLTEAYKSEGEYLHWMRNVVVENLDEMQNLFDLWEGDKLNSPKPLNDKWEGDKWKNIHGY
jgi:hypothetical protein